MKQTLHAPGSTLNAQFGRNSKLDVGRWTACPVSSFTGLGVGRSLPELL